MRIAICDNEILARDQLKTHIENWKNLRKLSVDIQLFKNAESFLCRWPETDFDLAFLDIRMKYMSGLQLAETIRKLDDTLMIVFVTSFQQYALKGYDVDALHYLIKPVRREKLVSVLDKAFNIWSSKKIDALYVSDRGVKKMLYLYKIYYISMFSHIATIHTSDNDYKMRKTAEELCSELPSQFIRCHRSYIVNLHKVECIHMDSLLLKDGRNVPVSRNNRKHINEAFIQLHGE